MNDKAEILKALVQLRECVPVLAERKRVVFAHFVYRPNYGICCNMDEYILSGEYTTEQEDAMTGFVEMLMGGWPHRSGECGYPVGGQREYVREYDSDNMWNNPRRIELLDWMIKILSEEVENDH